MKHTAGTAEINADGEIVRLEPFGSGRLVEVGSLTALA